MPAPEERWFSSDHGAAFPEDEPSQTQLRGSAAPRRQQCVSCLEGALMPGEVKIYMVKYGKRVATVKYLLKKTLWIHKKILGVI